MATFEDIKKANVTILTTDIKGKDYAEVNQRIKAFRMVHPNGTIETRIVKMEDGIVLMQTTVMDDQGNVLGTGFAQEKESSSTINKTSYIENCETSAIGRALGMCGIGIDVSVASYEEVSNAIAQQEEVKKSKPTEAHIKTIKKIAESKGYSESNICNLYGKNNFTELNFEEWNDACTKLNKKPDKEAK